MEQRYSVVALSFSEAQLGDTYTCGVSIECEFALGAGSATAPRLMPLGFIGFPHVADFATLVVNVRLLILQPLARLCVRCRISVMN